MSLTYFRQEAGVLERIRQREAQAAYRQTIPPDQSFSQRVSAIYEAYPHMPAGQIVAFARSGIDIGSEQMQAAADISYEQERKSGAFDAVGDLLGGIGSAASKVLNPVGSAIDTALGEVDEELAPRVRGGIRTGFVVLETGLQELQTFIRNAGWAGVRTQDELGTGSDQPMQRLLNMVNPANWDDYASNLGEAYETTGEEGSSGREVVARLLRGEDVDLGSGFLPGGEVEQEVRDASKRLTMKVGDVQFGGPHGQAISAGRSIAATVSEPGQMQYNVLSGLIDGGVAWFGDPMAALGAAAHTGRASARVGRATRALRDGDVAGAGVALATNPGLTKMVDRSLQSRAAEGLGEIIDGVTGRVTGTRNTLQPDVAGGWLTKGARPLAEKIATVEDPYELWLAMGKKVPMRLVKQWAADADPQSIMRSLDAEVGVGIREAPEFLGFKVRKSYSRGHRMAGEMPSHFIDPTDLDQTVDHLDRWLRNAKASPELRSSAINRMIRNDDPEATVSIMGDIMAETAEEMTGMLRTRTIVEPGGKVTKTAQRRARDMTKMWNRDVDALRTYAGQEIVENAAVAGITIGDETLDVAKPFLLSEYLNSVIPLPDAHDIRRATSSLGRLVDNPYFERTTGVLEGLSQTWKKLALLRGAYTVRVVGEEQVRLAASGMDSLFAHPISFLSALVTDTDDAGRFRRFMGQGSGRKRQADVLGDDFFDGPLAASDELKASLNKQSGGWLNDRNTAVVDRQFVLFGPEDEGYQRAWAQGIGELHHDVVARKVAEAGGNLEDVKAWFWSQQGKGFRKRMIEVRPELAGQVGADAYIDNVWQLVKDRTQSDPDLLDAVATGRINGAFIGGVNDAGRYSYTPELMGHLDDVVGPEAVKGQRILSHGIETGIKASWDKAMDFSFSYLMTKPTNYLSRSPSFRQRYWQRIEEQLPYMDDATRAKALAGAEGVVSGDQLKRMRKIAPSARRKTVTKRVTRMAKVEGKKGKRKVGSDLVTTETHLIDDLADADTIAKAFALDETKKLLYDLTERSQFFDAARLVFPFGEAWKEVMTRWAKIGMENPRAVRRGQQLIVGARGADLDGDGKGFFHKDVNGEEVFTYPLSRQLSKMLIGVPVDLKGRVSGLSLMTEVLPGVGPVVQIPAAAFLPEDSEWNWAREFVSPFGEADYSQGFVESFLPGWTKNLMQSAGSGSERQRANTVSQMFDYLASTGEYDVSKPEDLARMYDDARTYGSRLFALRGMTQFFSPTSPIPETLLEGEKGDELLIRREVIADLYRMQDELGYEEGMAEFVDRYGVEMLGVTQGMTKHMAPVLPVTKDASNWVRDNKGLVDDYALTWGMFAPNKDTDEIDLTEYGRQIAAGDRAPLTTEQRAALANARIGRYIVEQQEAKLPDDPTPEQRDWLAAVRERVRELYPGYGELVAGVPQGADLDQHVIPELRRAVADPRLRDTEQAKALRTYLEARDRALAYAEAEYGTKLGSQAAEPLRGWLREIGQSLARRYPSFSSVYDRTFSYELDV